MVYLIWIIIALILIVFSMFFLKKMIRFAVVLGIIFIILLILYPKECGYNFGNEIKKCDCEGYLKHGERTDLCYGFCSKTCICNEINETSSEVLEVECSSN